MTYLQRVSHIALRTHLSELPEQVIGGTPRKLFGLSLCAAPYFAGDPQPPLFAGDAALNSYLPWTWKWRDDPAAIAAGFCWRFYVRMQEAADATKTGWRLIPPEQMIIYGCPAGWNDGLTDDHNPAATPTIHDTWWRDELLRITTLPAGGWKDESGAHLAHAQQLERFYAANATQSITVDKDNPDPDSHADLLACRMLRWATAHPPYNYVNRLAAAVSLPSYGGLQTAMNANFATANPQMILPDGGVDLVAVPLWFADQAADPVVDAFVEPDTGFVVTDQQIVPDDGQTSANPYLRRAYANTVKTVSGGPAGVGGVADHSLSVEVEPWRKDVEARVARCLDLAVLVVDWAADIDVTPMITQEDLAKWVVGLSADLFQTRSGFPAAMRPANELAWLQMLSDAAATLNSAQRIPDTAKNQLDARIAAVRPYVQAPLPPNLSACVAALRDYLQMLRDPKLFSQLREQVEANQVSREAESFPDADWVLNALTRTLRVSVTFHGNVQTMAKAILPSLTENGRPIANIPAALRAYFEMRLAGTTAYYPQLASPANYSAALDSLVNYLNDSNVTTGQGKQFQNMVYGDRSRPLAKPHGLVLVADSADDVLDAKDDLLGTAGKNGLLQETAGAILLGRAAATVADLDTTPWMSLNIGVLRLRQPTPDGLGTQTTYLAKEKNATGQYVEQIIHDPLRPSYTNQRLSQRADYNNRPLTAQSRQDALVLNRANRLESTDPDLRFSPRLDFLFPSANATGPATITALRYAGNQRFVQFCWLQESPACTLPQHCWTDHPALLDLAVVPKVVAEIQATPSMRVSAGHNYLRRVGIGTIGLTFNSATSSAVPSTSILPSANAWPALPTGVFPISSELPSDPAHTELTTPTSAAPPLVMLFPTDNQHLPPSLLKPQNLVRGLVVDLHKPSTSDDNWERWVAADGIPLPARQKVCAEAHRERDKRAVDPNGNLLPLRWQPDEPALLNQCLIVFRRLYPSGAAQAKGFIRPWATSNDGAFYGPAKDYFTQALSMGLAQDATVPKGGLVQAAPGTAADFNLELGVVVEIAIYSLLPSASSQRFDDALRTPPAGPNSLGISVAQLVPGGQLLDASPEDPATLLAVSPNFLRLETANLNLPLPDDVYSQIRVTAQGSKVSFGLAANRAPETFDLVHEAVVQEQIWRWNGKPSMPEDYDNDPKIPMPTAGPVMDQADPTKFADHLAWDGIGFHNRDDREHLAVIAKLPLANPSAATSSLTGDVIFTDDKQGDLRALYFRFSALLRSRYFGAWPAAVQAGTASGTGYLTRVSPLWRRYVLPHRLTTPLKKPSVVLLLPLLASGGAQPQAGDTAGVLAIIKEACFEQAGLAEKVECELVSVDTYHRDPMDQLVKPDKRHFYEAGYDPILSSTALSTYQVDPGPALPSPLRISGPVGLTFDQGSRDPLIVNSVFFLGVDRSALTPLIQGPQPGAAADAAHLFCQIRLRRTIRPGYDAGPGILQPHPLASEWTQAQWVKFLPDSDLLRPSDGTKQWDISRNTIDPGNHPWVVDHWHVPVLTQAVDAERRPQFKYLFCITRHNLDAVGRPTTEFHSLYLLEDDGELAPLFDVGQPLAQGTLRLQGRVIEVLATVDSVPITKANWTALLFPDAHDGISKDAGPITEDVQLMVQSLSAAYPIAFS